MLLCAFIIAACAEASLIFELVGLDSSNGLISLLVRMKEQGRFLRDMAEHRLQVGSLDQVFSGVCFVTADPAFHGAYET